MKTVKTSTIKISDLNLAKDLNLSLFIDEYYKAILFYVDYLWNNRITYISNNEEKVFDVKNNLLNCPKFIPISHIDYDPILSARALSCAATQACGIIKSHIDKRKRLLFVRDKLKNNGQRTRSLTRKINNIILEKPSVDYIEPNLSSLCSKIEESKIKHFDHVLTLSSLGKTFGKIKIPFNYHKHAKKLESQGKLLKGLMISKTNIKLVFEMELPETKTEGITVGADQGINTCITLSDNQTTSKNKHGQDLNSILNKLNKKKVGSKSFNKTLEQRNNYINWSINQLNFSNISQINLEKISNFRYKKHTSKILNYFNESLIRQKLIDKAQQFGVQIVEQPSPFRSRRCSCCGYVSKKNRKKKNFSCKRCFFQVDADLNASLNHEIKLPFSFKLFASLRKIKEFFWKEEGFFNLDGSEITVPDTNKRYN